MRETYNCPQCQHQLSRYRNPVPTVDVLISFQGGIVLIERLNPPSGWALPGGFVDYGESLEVAAEREVLEETGLRVELMGQFHTYSNPERDPRQHTISTVFTALGRGKLEAGDDAGRSLVCHQNDLPENIAFDHRQIINDYFRAISKS
ncbi:MAG: NUDIX hydrolase [Deltaproteobacteria bacterium]|nr:NUDIX hydrolase [Deltaproteobacteria bacterium]